MKNTIDSPLTYVVGGVNAVAGYLETGTIKGAIKHSSAAMGSFIVVNGVLGTVVDEVGDKLED